MHRHGLLLTGRYAHQDQTDEGKGQKLHRITNPGLAYPNSSRNLLSPQSENSSQGSKNTKSLLKKG